MEGNVLKDFGNRLRKLREEAGLTQAQIARKSTAVIRSYQIMS